MSNMKEKQFTREELMPYVRLLHRLAISRAPKEFNLSETSDIPSIYLKITKNIPSHKFVLNLRLLDYIRNSWECNNSESNKVYVSLSEDKFYKFYEQKFYDIVSECLTINMKYKHSMFVESETSFNYFLVNLIYIEFQSII